MASGPVNCRVEILPRLRKTRIYKGPAVGQNLADAGFAVGIESSEKSTIQIWGLGVKKGSKIDQKVGFLPPPNPAQICAKTVSGLGA